MAKFLLSPSLRALLGPPFRLRFFSPAPATGLHNHAKRLAMVAEGGAPVTVLALPDPSKRQRGDHAPAHTARRRPTALALTEKQRTRRQPADACYYLPPISRVKALDNGLQLVPRRWRRRASQDSEGDYGEEEPFGFLRGQARPTIHRTPAQVLSDLAFVRVVDAEVDVLRVDGSATDRVPRPSLERERERRSEAPLTERKHYRASPDSVLLPRLVKAKKANEAMTRTKKEETANLKNALHFVASEGITGWEVGSPGDDFGIHNNVQ